MGPIFGGFKSRNVKLNLIILLKVLYSLSCKAWFGVLRLSRGVELGGGGGGARDTPPPISSDYQIVPSNNFNQTIIYIYIFFLMHLKYVIPLILPKKLKVNMLQNCTHLKHGRSKNRSHTGGEVQPRLEQLTGIAPSSQQSKTVQIKVHFRNEQSCVNEFKIRCLTKQNKWKKAWSMVISSLYIWTVRMKSLCWLYINNNLGQI